MDIDKRLFRHLYFEDTDTHYRLAISIGKNGHGEDIVLERPNMVALYLSISAKAISAAEQFYEEFTNDLRRKEGSHSFPSTLEGTRSAFDFLENICVATIFSYSAAEAFANSLIPDDYTRQGHRKGLQVLDTKIEIERHYTLREKYKSIIPEIYPTVSPQQQPFWSRFTELEKFRDGLIHLKMNESLRFGKERLFLSDFIFNTIKFEPYHAVPELIQYIVDNMNKDCAPIPYEFRNEPFRSFSVTEML